MIVVSTQHVRAVGPVADATTNVTVAIITSSVKDRFRISSVLP